MDLCCTGKMGQSVAEAALRAHVELVPYTLCGPNDVLTRSHVEVGGVQLELVPPAVRDATVADLKARYPNLMMVDYTLPDAIHSMVDFYVAHDTPFVMGTTGGDRARIHAQVEAARTFAVIAPNMGKQIVAFQAMMDMMAKSFPGAFAGYKLRVVESHQSTKKDTSGTAKAVVQSFVEMGIPFDVSQIELVREPKAQVELMKVPESAVHTGHAFHTYQLVSGDGSVMFEFQHNVVGRTTYAEGTVDACLFLAARIAGKAEQRLYNMIDVLRAGDMR
ncbi:Dihydrodipicolinate reductase 1, chloroplastic [Tetrabaena socialis]|uniref:4-hydroxy-tetrahydrodipicolinate reductase n=1 Tax=Tetrabaena socialis TaxID=47790 RepID=A0A2J7ZHU5_9CHLO|nr:Dihydrodipicolinate reductase 1, chloroplastic [Tetrabaena socialis]|eukprot:PNG99838.1 Dihydrodipicolinate reductase 1, chloroplastic [Tetrabaena socialis]